MCFSTVVEKHKAGDERTAAQARRAHAIGICFCFIDSTGKAWRNLLYFKLKDLDETLPIPQARCSTLRSVLE